MKISKENLNPIFRRRKKILQEKFNTLSYAILGLRDSTRNLQSTMFQNPGLYREPDTRRITNCESNIGLLKDFKIFLRSGKYQRSVIKFSLTSNKKNNLTFIF